ncbi:unnamed protein product [Rodentolepis nana]|uniref:BSD domain-containing protein n=1 Tax=Rodentolepis nana TaxID=102285 RepID=A0A0R3TXC5_RODNA|nr:unnamed protein product [Rodentolepis nana]
MADVDENYPANFSSILFPNESLAPSTASPQFEVSTCKGDLNYTPKMQTQGFASTTISDAIEKNPIISDSDGQLIQFLHSDSTGAELQMIDDLIDSPEQFLTLPSEKQAFVLYWIMYICEFLYRDIEKGTVPPGIMQKFEVKGRSYEEYRTDLQYLLHAVNGEFPGVLQIYRDITSTYLKKTTSK